MNCMSFRRALSVAPASWNEELRRHREECPGCEAFARRQAAFEATLAEAVRVDVPEGLASRVLLAQSLRDRRAKRVGRRVVLASALVALAAGWLAIAPGRLEEAVFAHIEAERSHLVEPGELSISQVNEALAPLGIEIDGELGTIRYAGTCWIRRHLGGHLVLQGERGPVTAIFLPGESVDGRLRVRHERFQGIIVPVGSGSLAIVGEPGESLQTIERRLRRALRLAFREGPMVVGGRHV